MMLTGLTVQLALVNGTFANVKEMSPWKYIHVSGPDHFHCYENCDHYVESQAIVAAGSQVGHDPVISIVFANRQPVTRHESEVISPSLSVNVCVNSINATGNWDAAQEGGTQADDP